MGSRLTGIVVCGLAALALAASAEADVTLPPETLQAAAPNWASPQIAAVVAAGVMGPDVATFRPDDSLTRGELHDAIVALGKPHKAPPDPMRIVTMRELDAQLVAAAGLLPSARTIRLAARDAGLEPIDMLGTETVARLLGLRLNHPVGSEQLERSPRQPASRAEAAYSLSKLLGLEPWRVTTIQQLTGEFAFPVLTDWQRAVLTRALRFVGYPYVFSGSSEKTQRLWSATSATGTVVAPGGFDCSGLIWRVFKLEPFPGARAPARGAEGADDVRDERRGREAAPHRRRLAHPRRHPLLREQRPEVEADRGRARRHLRRQRVVRPLVERRRHAPAAPGLVLEPARLGAPPARRGRAVTRTAC